MPANLSPEYKAAQPSLPCAGGLCNQWSGAIPQTRTRVGERPGFDGQRVGRGHVVADGDIVELHG